MTYFDGFYYHMLDNMQEKVLNDVYVTYQFRIMVLTTGAATMKKVAAYARVLTDYDEQLSSFDAQVDYYRKHIKSNPVWTFAEVYTDEGISATSTKKRDGFNRMISDALNGKIDLIIIKSVSRFARNTVDTLTTVRKLKEKGVEGEDGLPKIVEKEAVIVRLIYKLFLEGKTPSWIARHLTTNKIPTPGGKEIWQQSTVLSILQNEKYKGDAILQKSFTVDFLTKKKKINEGEVPQYYVENSHPAIITPEVFDLTQSEIKKRKRVKGYKTSGDCFSGKIVCGECGSFYGSKVWHSTSKYRRVIWQCNAKFKNDEKCSTPHLYEDTLKKAFLEAFNSLLKNKDKILQGYEHIIQALTDTLKLDKESTKLQSKLEIVTEMLRKCVEENAHSALDQAEYEERYNSLTKRYEAIENKITEINDKRIERTAKQERIEEFIKILEKSPTILTEFDDGLWNSTVEIVKMNSERDITFVFKDGFELQWNIQG